MRVYKSLERKSWVLGLPMTQIGLLICLFLVLTVLGSLIAIVVAVSGWYYLGTTFLTLALYLLLRRAARKQHPDYLLSFLSYRFYQPQRIDYEGKNLPSDPSLPRDHP
jgi:hypothetical protein